MKREELTGFAPDLDIATPGILVDCGNIVPTEEGLRPERGLITLNIPALPADCTGAATVMLRNNGRRFFAGTAATLYELVGDAWVDVSAGLGASNWDFAQFGDATIAAGSNSALLVATESGSFAQITDAPEARHVISVAGFILAFATIHVSNGENPDMWWSSGLYDHTQWTPSQATQAANGRFLDSPGEIRGAAPLGETAVVYKQESMYLGRYIGPPIVWTWEQISDSVGVAGQGSIVNTGIAHLFVGAGDIWYFDGTRPRSIGAPVRRWLVENSAPEHRHLIKSYYDRANDLVTWYFPQVGSTKPDVGLVYHMPSGKWGLVNRTIDATVEFFSPGITYDSFGDHYPTYDEFEGFSYNSPAWHVSESNPAVFVGGQCYVASGSAMDSYLTTGKHGDPVKYATVNRIIPVFSDLPGSSSIEHGVSDNKGTASTYSAPVTMQNGRYDLFASARWHQEKISFTGDYRLNGLVFEGRSSGRD